MLCAIEFCLAEFICNSGIDMEYNPFVLNSGTKLAIINENWQSKLLNAIIDYWKKNNDDINIKPVLHLSDINGIAVMVHKYYENDDALDGLLSGNLKESNLYRNIMDLGIGSARYNVADFKSFLVDHIAKDIGILISTCDNDTEVTENETQDINSDDIDITDEDKKFIKKTNEFFNMFIKEYGDPSVYYSINNDKNTAVGYGTLGTYPDISMVNELVEKTGKNIIILFNGFLGMNCLLSQNTIKHSDFEESDTLLIHLCPAYDHRFMCLNGDSRPKCFGYTLNDLFVLHAIDPNFDIRNNRQNGSDKEADKIIKEKINSPYSKFDKIFKDNVTNIVWALKDRNIITFTKAIKDDDISRIMMKELIRRLDNDIKYSELLKIDIDYHNQISERNKEDYINFSVESVSSALEELNRLKSDAESDYKIHVDKAMESGKMMEMYITQINAFDSDSMKRKEEEKALKNYNETLALNKVSSINIEDGLVHVYTHNLYAKDERNGSWHDIGTFHIQIGMLSNDYDTSNTVRVYNTKHQINAYQEGMQAPHIFNDGRICHGNLAIGMVASYKNRNLYEMVLQLILFLQLANTDDVAGAFINKWPEVTEEEATNTKNDSDIKVIMEEISEVEKEFDEAVSSAIPILI